MTTAESKREAWEEYELRKAAVQKQNLTAEAYEEAIAEIVEDEVL